ncbi:MAG: transcription termination factor Rho, partial [Actinomycetota bacterium]|nr:transcription termination factor Rho [Actinomycetota bacterium]
MAGQLSLDVKNLKKKDEIIDAVLAAKLKAEGFVSITGILDVLPEGYGFIRTSGYLPGDTDVYCSMSQVRRSSLRRGDMITGQVRPPKDNEKYPALLKVMTINDKAVEEARERKRFGDLTPVYPDQRFRLEHGKDTITARIIDLVAPIGKGQRALIVSPPKAGKTTILKEIAAAITANTPDAYLMCLLVDERPEEVTHLRRQVKAEVLASSSDHDTASHVRLAETVMAHVQCELECGRDVVVLVDSITRMARAFNSNERGNKRTMSGGVGAGALEIPRKFFGMARNVENGGSVTVIATALIETGSRMDDLIFQEFKGTGNMELVLSRSLAEERIFPAIDLRASGTRRDDLLYTEEEMVLL